MTVFVFVPNLYCSNSGGRLAYGWPCAIAGAAGGADVGRRSTACHTTAGPSLIEYKQDIRFDHRFDRSMFVGQHRIQLVHLLVV